METRVFINQTKSNVYLIFASLAVAFLLAGCSSTQTSYGDNGSNTEAIAKQTELLEAREAELTNREVELQLKLERMNSGGRVGTNTSLDQEFLPPNAETGKCYARVWVEPTYKESEKQVLTSEAYQNVEILPARYEKVQEKLLKKPEATELVTIPAVYDTVTEEKMVKAGGKFWKTSLRNGAPVDGSLLQVAKNAGIDIDGSVPGDCYHEHFLPAKFEVKKEKVLVSEASARIEPVEAQYRWVEKQVLVSEASTKLQHFPAKYETVTEQVIDKPAHKVWKKGAGPIQKIDEATGEIMCLVEVPATYKTISKQALVSKAETRSVEVPAQYKTVKVRELVSDTTERRIEIPAKYEDIEVTQKVSDPSFVWHVIEDNTMDKASRTGRQICMIKEEPVYQTVAKRVVVTPAQVVKKTIPAEYDYVTVEKLVEDAKEVSTTIPATYKTVSIKELDQDGRMEWRSILCETNMTSDRIGEVQQALKNAGYNPGRIDGVIGIDTMRAVNSYQRENDLPVDKYLNLETLEALSVSAM